MDKLLVEKTRDTLMKISDILYKGDVEQGIIDMGAVIPDLSVVVTWIEDEQVQNKLMSEALAPALEAMECKDGTMLADIISYELVELLNGMLA